MKQYTSAEVRRYSEPDALWMILFNNVYDVTTFAASHPGGVEVLYDCGGADATEAFEDVGHSSVATQMLGPYLIGTLVPEEHRPYAGRPVELPVVLKKPKHEKRVWALLAVMAVAVVLVVGLQKVKLGHVA